MRDRTPECIPPQQKPHPDRPLQIEVYRKLQAEYRNCLNGITPAMRERIMITQELRKHLSEYTFPGKSIVLIAGKEFVELTLTNNVDSVFISLGDDIVDPKLLMHGVTGIDRRGTRVHIFDVEDPKEAIAVGSAAIKILEILRHPKTFGYKNPQFSLNQEKRLILMDEGKNIPIPLFLKYVTPTQMGDVLDFINEVLGNIPKTKSDPTNFDSYEDELT